MNTNKNPFSATQFREGCLQNRYCDFDHFLDYLILPWLFKCKLYLPAPAQGVREKARVFETLNFFVKGLIQMETDVQLL